MAETSLGVFGIVKTILQSAAAGLAFGEAALFAVEPSLTKDGALLTAATLAAGRAGSTGVGVVTACLVFTSVLISLGCGFLLAAMVMKLLTNVGVRLPWLVEATTGASVVVGAVTTGVLAGILPPWIYIAAQGILVLVVYSYSNINDMTTALLIIFTTLYLSVLYGRMGVMVGLFVVGLTISVLCALRKALTERMTQRTKSKTGCKLLERIFFYSVFVGILGFSVGLGAGEAGEGSEAEVVLMLQSVLWVAFLSAGLLGAGLGTVAMVGLGPEVAGKIAVGAAIISSVSLRAILQSSSSLGTRSSIGGTLGAATAAGVSLGAASVAAKQAFGSRNSTLATLGSVVVGAILAMQGVALKVTLLTTSELLTITLVAVGAFVLGAPKSPFHTQVNLQRGLLSGPELIKGIGMETVTAAAAPIGAGALGAAALGTAALGRLGTVGVLVAILLALGSALSGMIGKSPPTTSAHRE
ncbi:hypothetical protein EPR50_G00187140 [Perca flavescens]|uniref:Uncharacterized protein n=1 Tax=Perca flavescens TaxID=8167 RepID=A0A484CE83_PERFV|nr:uncharacterized protein LOC114572937 [Perca flavescens]TDH00303.1 hypothetical protein EPR50_G00187140 [Perca flavescens]